MRKVESQEMTRTQRSHQKTENKGKGLAGKRAVIIVIAVALILVSVVGVTMAYLTSETDPVTNTFTYGDINITLAETENDLDADGDKLTNTYKMFPGKDIEKDPKVTVCAGSEDNWLFVKLEKSDNFDEFMTYELEDEWTALENNEGVYYMEVSYDELDQEFGVLKGDKVSVKAEVTKQQLNALDENGTYPTLTITAFAVQRDAEIGAVDTAVEAWAIAQEQNDNNNTTTP